MDISTHDLPMLNVYQEQFAKKCAEKSLTCTICYDPYNNPHMINKCLHVFCQSCITDWMQNKNTCPICNITFDAKDLKHDFDKQSRIEHLWKKYVLEISNPENEPEASTASPEVQNGKEKVFLKMGIYHRTNKQLHSICSKEGVLLINCVVTHKIITNKGSIEAEGCTLNKIQARNGALLKNTTFTCAKISKGKLESTFTRYDSSSYHAYDIIASDDVKLENMNCKNQVSVTLGQLKATQCHLKKVYTLRGITLKDCIAESIHSKRGSLNAVGCQLGTVHIDPDAILHNCCANKVKVRDGKIIASADKNKESNYDTLKALNEINLKSITVRKKVSSHGSVTATDSTIVGSVKCFFQIQLTNSNIGDLIIYGNHNRKCSIILSKGIIEGDIYIYEANNTKITGTGQINGNIYCHCHGEVTKNERVLFNGKLIDDYFDDSE